jgi:hypothetical protein
MIRRRALAILTGLAIIAAALYAAAVAQPGARAATWTWEVALPGTVVDRSLQAAAASAGADPASARALAAADGATLLVAHQARTLEIGLASGGSVHFAALTKAAGQQAVIAYTATTPQAGEQELVGVVRADIDRVDALLADGSERDLSLNLWRGFSYVASSPSTAAVGIVAYSSGSSIDSVRLPQVVAQSQTVSASAPLYGVFRTSLRDQLLTIAQVDPRTLHQKPGPSLQLKGQWFGNMALSPDGTQLAIEAGMTLRDRHGAPEVQRLMIADLSAMKLIRSVTLGSYTQIRMLAWPEQNRLIEIEQRMSKPYQRDVRSRTALIINTASGRIVARHALTNKLAVRTSLSTPLGLVLLLGSSSLHGTTEQLDLVTADGRVRSISIPVGATKGTLHDSALSVDTSSGHAYVVIAGGTVFDIDLHSMTLTKHVVPGPTGSTLVPPPISRLQANVFAGKIAVASMFHLPNNTTTPAQGVYLIDPSSWTATVLDPTANLFETLGNRLLTYGITTPPRHSNPMTFESGHGLSLYDENGKLVAHLYGHRRFQYIALAPGYGHVIYTGAATVALNPHSGRVAYFGPNDELSFNLETGATLGHAKVSTAVPPLGPPQLIFHGSAAVGEGTFG